MRRRAVLAVAVLACMSSFAAVAQDRGHARPYARIVVERGTGANRIEISRTELSRSITTAGTRTPVGDSGWSCSAIGLRPPITVTCVHASDGPRASLISRDCRPAEMRLMAAGEGARADAQLRSTEGLPTEEAGRRIAEIYEREVNYFIEVGCE